ncbi:MAG: SIS domain-containing protein [Deltaproteobacteria bacterium]|nr:SIS domain-containing protein [Deltaproteobacteria bacterium]
MPIYIGRFPGRVPAGSLVLFPLRPGMLACGLSGFVAYKKRPAPAPEPDLDQLEKDIEVLKAASLTREKVLSAAAYLGGDDLLESLAQNAQSFKDDGLFYRLIMDRDYKARVAGLAGRLTRLAMDEENALYALRDSVPPEDIRVFSARMEKLKDCAWCLEHEVLEAADKTGLLARSLEPDKKPEAMAVFREINTVLSSLDRLEVRGRDSAGISVLLHFSPEHFQAFLQAAEHAGLSGELEERQKRPLLLAGSLSVHQGKACSLGFVYKVAAEIGRLGENVAALRRQVNEDKLLALAASLPIANRSITGHTRWASVGAITEANCHPVDNLVSTAGDGQALIHVSLNGDIDNHEKLKAEYEARTGRRVPPEITTDTKIIPLVIEKHLLAGADPVEAFRLAVGEFTGSHAIFMHTDLAPGKLFLAQKGSGQTLFVGMGERGYFPSSEVYGFVEETSRFIKLSGEKTVDTPTGPVSGQVFVLDQEGQGLSGIRAMYYDGTPLELSEADIQSTAITSRDIDRQGFAHYFLKEITESPVSVEKTLLDRWRIDPAAGKVSVHLDETVVPEKLKTALESGALRRIHFIGQGTAGVAARACSEIVKYYLKDTVGEVSAKKASELSASLVGRDSAARDLSDTLVVAITQSGTTTDTNRCVDMARAMGAHTLCIVNRRDSDITFKTDGVLYTSSGRDVEMSVASTKAFYSQIVAGALLGLFLARTSKARDDDFVAREVRELLALSNSMREILGRQATIAESARRLAPARTYWAVVGSGPNKASADEIRIKLSELCYKTISTDYVEDKKHIDLSSEPLILVCAAGSPEEVLSDIIKDTAIFQAHKAAPVVIADEGETRFDDFAEHVIHVPSAPPHLAPIVTTLAGHLWGYHAALAINRASEFLFGFREALNKSINAFSQKNGAADAYELLLETDFREVIAHFYSKFREMYRTNRYPAGVAPAVPTDLSLLAKYLTGRLPMADFFLDFGTKGTPANMLQVLMDTLSFGINQTARPVDAIKHQAKTVTVGTSRIAEKAEGLLFEALARHGFSTDQLINRNVLVLKNLQKVVKNIKGTTLYRIGGLSLLGEPTDKSFITLVLKEGTAANIPSRVEEDRTLKGTKRIIVARGNVYIGKGRKDNRSLVAVPLIGGKGPRAHFIEHLLLWEIGFLEDVPTRDKARALGGKGEHIKNLVQESSRNWEDSYLDLVPLPELFGRSAEKIAEAILDRLKDMEN